MPIPGARGLSGWLLLFRLRPLMLPPPFKGLLALAKPEKFSPWLLIAGFNAKRFTLPAKTDALAELPNGRPGNGWPLLFHLFPLTLPPPLSGFRNLMVPEKSAPLLPIPGVRGASGWPLLFHCPLLEPPPTLGFLDL